ncbi:MAG: NAD(P)-binding domain-containing protein [Anaerolineales bacterium]
MALFESGIRLTCCTRISRTHNYRGELKEAIMSKKPAYANAEPYEAIIIGAGICGIIFLKYAREQGLRCLALEKQDAVGGLWNWIPAWQDIQIRKKDFAINDVPLDGVKQPDVLQHLRQWVQKYNLAAFIKLQHEVTSVSWMGEEWQVQTNQATFRANYLIAASGVQNEPWIPDIERSHPDVIERHSSNLLRPEELADQSVTVVGGGASAWDLLDLAIENGAKDIHWVYRNIRWFIPTHKTKQTVWPNLRELSLAQTVMGSMGPVNSFFRRRLKKLFTDFQLTEVAPAEPLDFRKHQLIPGRSLAIQNLDSISRHQTKIRQVRGREISLENGEHFETDTLLWGTGYRMNLEYLDLPEYSGVDTLDGLRPKLGSLIRSLDYPNLFFIGMTLIDISGSTPFFAAIEAKSIVAHILGQCEIPNKKIPDHIVRWDLFKYFASFDHANYPRFWWKIKNFLLVWWYEVFQNKRVQV